MMFETPMMQYLISGLFSAWAVDKGNWEAAWNFQGYEQLTTIQDVTMRGVSIS